MYEGKIWLSAALCAALCLCVYGQTRKTKIRKEVFGKMADGKRVDLYTLANKNGVEAKITTYGGAVVSLKTPDKGGKFADVVLGFDKLSDYFTPTDASAITTGDLRDVTNTPFDFRNLTAIGARIGQDDEQLKFGQGYDHNFVVKGNFGTLRPAAKVVEPNSGRVMEVFTTEPGIQLYTGNFLNGSKIGKGVKSINLHAGFCLETQHFPDSPNQPKFPATTLKKGAKFTSTH